MAELQHELRTDQRQARIAAIIPSFKGNVEPLVRALFEQSWPPDEVKVVKGVSPNGRARNMGVASTTAEILFFVDDDAIPGTPDLIEKVVRPLLQDASIGVSGAARVLPPDASWFERRVAAEIPRTVNPVPRVPLEVNPPLSGYGHSLVTTTCCAMWRGTFQQAGGFSEEQESGVDTDFFYRVRRLGCRFIMVPEVYVNHPAPGDLRSLLRKFHWYGVGYAQEVRRRPEQRLGPALPTYWHRLLFLTAATLWLMPNIFVPYSPGYPHLEIGFRPLKALSSHAVARGYAAGWGRSQS